MSDLSEQLAREEPPVEPEDTHPGGDNDTQPNPVIRDDRQEGWQRYLGGMILLAALVLTVAAGIVIFWERDTTEEAAVSPTPFDDFTPFSRTDTPATPTEYVPPTPDAISEIEALPTAAMDEQAIALLTPVVNASQSEGIVVRPNLPITVGNAESMERGISMHTIGAGDTWQKIAGQYELDLCTIVWANADKKSGPLQRGDTLIIPPGDGVFAKVTEPVTIADLATETKVDPYAIIDSPYNPDLFNAAPETLLPEGVQVMIPNGEGVDCSVWEPGPVVVGDGSGSSVNQAGGLWGCQTEIHTTGFPYGHPIPGGGYTYFRGFMPGHPAVDLSGTEGTPIAAAGDGTVVFAGWNSTGYGNAVVIAHGGHYTLYAHMLSRPNVSCGQAVSGGQTIGFLGNTGNSTGPHLHYEIRNASFNALDPCTTISC